MKFELIAGILFQGLKLWNEKDAKKHLKDFLEHMENYYAEMDKPSYESRNLFPDLKFKNFRDNNVIDLAQRGVYLIGKAYSNDKSGGQGLRDLIKK